jgi:hypothetical protein
MIRLLSRCLVLALALVLVASAAPLFAQAKAMPKAQAPILLTSCGQSPGPARIKVFLQRQQVDYDMKDTATVKDLDAKPYKSLIIVTGSSLKGMGAAGVSITDEISRVNALIAEAKKKGITVIGAHVEGMERRAKGASAGDNSDEQSIDAVCPKSQFLIVRKDGDEDGRFTAFQKKNVPVVFFEKNTELAEVLKGIFAK